jgi:WD40 repeat protein
MVAGVTWSPNSDQFASASHDGTVRVWGETRGVERACLRGHDGMVASMAFAPDGRRLASASAGGLLRVWDPDTGIDLARLRGREGMFATLVWSADGSRILSESSDGTTCMWDTETWERLVPARGSGRKDARSAGAGSPSFRAVTRGLETVIENPQGGPPIAWFPATLGTMTPDLTSTIWSGSKCNYLFIVMLEAIRTSADVTSAGGSEDPSPVEPVPVREWDR